MELTETLVQLQPGDLICIYTDGVVEARDPHGEMYGLDRVIETLQEQQSHGVAACLEALYDNMRLFTNGEPQRDDLTLVGFEVTGLPSDLIGPVPTVADTLCRPPQGAALSSAGPYGAGLVTSSGRYRSIRGADGPTPEGSGQGEPKLSRSQADEGLPPGLVGAHHSHGTRGVG